VQYVAEGQQPAYVSDIGLSSTPHLGIPFAFPSPEHTVTCWSYDSCCGRSRRADWLVPGRRLIRGGPDGWSPRTKKGQGRPNLRWRFCRAAENWAQWSAPMIGQRLR